MYKAASLRATPLDVRYKMSELHSAIESVDVSKMELDTIQTAEVLPEYEKDVDSELPPAPILSPAQQKKLWRKVDIRIVPILSVMYLCCYLDRGTIGNAKLQGLMTQLDLTGNRYNIALTFFYIPYCLFDPPANLILKRLRPSIWLPGITVAWGLVLALMGLVKSYPQLVGARLCLGIAEAGIFPGVTYFMTLWYPRHMVQTRIALFCGGTTLSGAFSGLLAYGISFMSGAGGMLGWSWLFIIEGIATVVVGTVAFFILAHVDFPETATFLTDQERAYIAWTKRIDSHAVREEERFEMRHLTSALLDWQIWLQIVLYWCIAAPLNGMALFLPSIINGFGYGTAVSQLLTVPPYICATIVLVVFAVWSDHIKLRSPFLFAGLLISLVGFVINISNAPIGVKYFGTFFCVSGSYAAFPGVVAWLGNNLAGQYKRAIGMGIQIGIGNINGIVASNLYRPQQAPRYIMGHGLEIMFLSIGLVILPLVVALYARINSQRDKEIDGIEKGAVSYSDEELQRMGDRAPRFRYML
ncbi:MFS general substrate transporter [Fomitopsis serialis]|uniref:MFS general substrate transporter n=1 Tax=Fomitopsis serialis TaxID=139415 RepID=UPI002008DD34|nr:MFS general substrate transporter [Neoantrodia serialis]KAH9919553.1 MFS general substrate transporter [Neoantrodia serialis]